MRFAAVALVATLALAGCGDKPQTAGAAKKTDAKPWDTPTSPVYTDGSWKSGDKAAWENHLRARAQAQNEYARSAPAASAQQ